MRSLKAVWSELVGLFVDDGSFAAAILTWVGVSWLLSGHVLRHSGWSGGILFGGLGLLLLESTTRRSRR